MPHTPPAGHSLELPPVHRQAETLVDLGVAETAGLSAATLRTFAQHAGPERQDVLVVLHHELSPASALAPLLRRGDKPGFVVEDMPDADQFTPYQVEIPDAAIYLVHGLDRGDHLANWSPEEALPDLTANHRTPLLLTEGIHWVLQQPGALERNQCFMTIGSRLRKANGAYDSRTPAVWISNGTGRDGRERRNAPKVGWCWWRNRHTWLGFGSTTGREARTS